MEIKRLEIIVPKGVNPEKQIVDLSEAILDSGYSLFMETEDIKLDGIMREHVDVVLSTDSEINNALNNNVSLPELSRIQESLEDSNTYTLIVTEGLEEETLLEFLKKAIEAQISYFELHDKTNYDLIINHYFN